MGIRVTGLNSGLDTDSIIQALMSAHSLKLTKLENKKTKNEWTQDKWKELNTKIYALYTGELSTARLKTSYATKKASTSNEDACEVSVTNSAASGSHTLQINALASSQYITGAQTSNVSSTSTKLTDAGFTEGEVITVKTESGEEKTLTVGESTKVSDLISTCTSAGINASFDTTQKRFFLSSSTSGSDQAFSITCASSDGTSSDSLSEIGLGNITTSTDSDGKVTASSSNSAVSVVQAQDAEIVLDGATLTCSTNETTINGMKLTLKETTDTAVSITVSNDTQAVYDMVSSLISTYNSVLGDMNTAYYADSSTGYDPLTDEEKEAMTDDQIEKWETKIQDSLLRRDSTLGSLLTSFKSIMSSTVYIDSDGNLMKDDDGNMITSSSAAKAIDSNAKGYSLSSLGICTSTAYTEKGLLHIKGDSDDSTYSDSTNTLMAMIESDPDLVCSIVQGISSKLYSTMTSKMGKTSLSSALTFYNDKQLSDLDDDYDDEIEKMKDKLADLEDRYYSQFTAMETAMATLNSQQSALSSLLGS